MMAMLALCAVFASGCGVYEAFQEVNDLQTVLKDNSYANPQVNISVQTKNKETTRTITAKVDRPRNAGRISRRCLIPATAADKDRGGEDETES